MHLHLCSMRLQLIWRSIVLKLNFLIPAVSQIWSFISLLSIFTLLNLKSTPIVESNDSLKFRSTKRLSKDDLPTAESPTKTNLYYFAAVFSIYCFYMILLPFKFFPRFIRFWLQRLLIIKSKIIFNYEND